MLPNGQLVERAASALDAGTHLFARDIAGGRGVSEPSQLGRLHLEARLEPSRAIARGSLRPETPCDHDAHDEPEHCSKQHDTDLLGHGSLLGGRGSRARP
jgi:hypothetical protein